MGRDRPAVPRAVRLLRHPRRARPRDVPWRAGRGYDVDALTNLLPPITSGRDRVLEQVGRRSADLARDARARLLRQRRARAVHGRAVHRRRHRGGGASGATVAATSGSAALRDLAAGTVQCRLHRRPVQRGRSTFPTSTRCCCLRPTESPTLFLQQLGRGLRKARGKTRLHGAGLRRHAPQGVPLRPPVSRAARRLAQRRRARRSSEASRSCRPAAASSSTRSRRTSSCGASATRSRARWRDECNELALPRRRRRSATYLDETGLELEDIYAGNHSWSEMRRAAGLPTAPPGPDEAALLRGGRAAAPRRRRRADRRLPRFLAPRRAAGRSTSSTSATGGCCACWSVRSPSSADRGNRRSRRSLELLGASAGPAPSSLELLDAPAEPRRPPASAARPGRASRCALHARYTRLEILAAFGVGDGREAAALADRRLLAKPAADRPVRLHPRQEHRRLLADDPLPRLRDQPRADPLGEPVGHVRRQRDRPALHQPDGEEGPTSCSSPASAPTTEPSGASAPLVREPRGRPADRVRLEVPRFRPTCSRRLPPRWREPSRCLEQRRNMPRLAQSCSTSQSLDSAAGYASGLALCPSYGVASQRFRVCTRASEAWSVASGSLPERTALTSAVNARALSASPLE